MRHILLATGFLQDRWHCGLAKTAYELRSAGAGSVSIHNWRDDAASIANQLCHFDDDDELVFIGYSFGGHLVTEIAKYLDRPISSLYLCDAVVQPSSWSISEWRKRSVEVPPNVQKLWSWRQTFLYPKGSAIQVTPSTEWVYDAVLKDVRHGKMDVHPDFLNTIYSTVIGRK